MKNQKDIIMNQNQIIQKMARTELEEERNREEEYKTQLSAESEAMAIQQDMDAQNEYEQQEKRKKAMELIDQADWETLLQMVGFVFDKQFIEGHLIASMKLADEKKIDDFIELFKEQSEGERE